MICDPGEVVVVPFPFTDQARTKRRPALVLSGHTYNQRNAHTVVAMVTSTKPSAWHLDTPFDWGAAGLARASIVRMKLATLDNRIIIRKVGKLLPADWTAVMRNFQQIYDAEVETSHN
jgi:mRNA interferase MazF